jgi:hypothetical protein
MERTTVGQMPIGAPPLIQRTPEENGAAEKRPSHRAVRVPPPSSRPKVQRAPLPLAKQRTSSKVIQRTEDDEVPETYLGTTAGDGARGSTQTQNLGGSDANFASKNSIMNSDNGQSDGSGSGDKKDEKKDAPDLDRLARAILPIIKRMLSVERNRRNPRPVF